MAQQNFFEDGKIVPVNIREQMKQCYIDYAMSVIIGRALPDVRDGLKPVHRRILYTMFEDGLSPDKAYIKCANTVGSVLGRYHPHGDASVYDALVRLAQDFSMRYMLVDGHGNFGSVDGDPPAAYRYTESRMSKISLIMLTDIEKDTVDFAANYDDRRKEPTVLPSRFPNLLVNGSTGIAVGMATNIPPHNMREVVDAMCCLIDNPDAELSDLMDPYAYFPTGAIIMGRSGIRSAYATGRGKIVVRAKTEIVEDKNSRFKIIVTELPYQVNKARLIENIAEMVKDKKTMLRFLQLEKIGFNQYGFRKLVSVFLTKEIKYTNYQVKSRVNLIQRELKRNKEDFYDILRIISKAYEMERKSRPDLKTIEAIYKESKKPHVEPKVAFKEAPAKDFYHFDGVLYQLDQIPFDLDDLRHIDTDYLPDGLGDIREKRSR